MSAEERSSPLLEDHRSLGAKLTSFAGWDMPLQYRGVIHEHTAVRERVGVFDVSHLGKLRLKGSRAVEALEEALTADVAGLDVGSATYSLVLTSDGGCVDDVFLYRLATDEWLVVPNAANVTSVSDSIRDSGGEAIDEWERWAILAVQGPASFDLVAGLWPDAAATDLDLHAFSGIELDGHPGIVARTGYTGERGFELYVPSEVASSVFRRILDAGSEPVGLGARDTLRLEMGYALYGHELSEDINPLEAGLGWVLAWDNPFRGRSALEKVKEAGPDRKLFAVRCTGRGVPRQGYSVVAGERRIGEVTSGNFSPTLGVGIALALGPRSDAPAVGDRVEIEGRGRRIEGDIVRPPFVERGKKRSTN